MFSNITEAWDHDPVKEMTNKLSKNMLNIEKNNKNENLSMNDNS